MNPNKIIKRVFMNAETLKQEGRLIAFGDIHGCSEALNSLLEAVKPTQSDTLIFLGDYIDRGSNSKAVLDTIIRLTETHNVIALIGNHEVMMCDAFLQEDGLKRQQMIWAWYNNGGVSTLNSYNYNFDNLLDVALDSKPSDLAIPAELEAHLKFISKLPFYHITDTHIFVHATPYPDQDIEKQLKASLVWRRATEADKKHNYTHKSGKVIVSGHTAQQDGKPLALSDKNIIIDTGSVWTGWLTAMDVTNNKFIQASVFESRTLSYEDITKNNETNKEG